LTEVSFAVGNCFYIGVLVYKLPLITVAKVDTKTRRYSRLYKIRGSRLLNMRPEESQTRTVNKSILAAVELPYK